MTLIVAVVLAFGFGFLFRPFVDGEQRHDFDHFDEHYQNLSHYDD